MVEIITFSSDEFESNIKPYLNDLLLLQIAFFTVFEGDDETDEEIINHLLKADAIALTVDELGEVVGFATMYKFEDHLELAHAFVYPEHRNKGLWKEMNAALVSRAKERGRPLIVAYPANPGVKSTLKKMGFTRRDDGDGLYLDL